MRPSTPSPRPTRRRGVHALLVTALVALLLAGGSGFIVAADAGDRFHLGAYAERFSTAEPMIGDRGVYTKEQFRGNGTGRPGAEVEFATFEWVEHPAIWDASGTPRSVVGLRFLEDPILDDAFYFNPREANATWLVDPAEQSALAVRSEERDITTQVVGGLPQAQREEHEHRGTAIDFPPPHRPEQEPLFCGMLHALQGETQDVRDGIALFPHCRFDDWGGPPANTTFRPEGIARIGDTTTLVLHAAPAPRSHAEKAFGQFYGPMGPYGWDWKPTRVDVRVWLAPDNPYPLRIESYDPEGDSREVYRLAAFERGDTPFPQAADLPDPLPPIDARPLLPWGPDDSDIDHPYPLSAAYRNARDDPSYPDLREFLEAHPDAQTTMARYRFGEDDGRRSWTWHFQVWGGPDLLMVCTERHGPRAPDALGMPGAAAVDTHETCAEHSGRRTEWARFPAHLPTVRSLVTLWQATFDTEAAPNSYGFSTFCPTDFGRPVDPCTYRFTIGNEKPAVVAEGTTPLTEDREQEGTQQRLVLTGEGRLLRYENVTWTLHAKEGAPERSSAADQTLTALATSTPVWILPAGAPMVGAALLAAFSGLLYWLWPSLKTGLFAPLFSRIQRDRALDHPIRSELHTAVADTPGLHIQGLVRSTGHPQGTVRHHLGKLVEAGLLHVQKTDGLACYFADVAHTKTAERASVLRSDGAQAVLAALTAHPGASGASLAAATGLTRQTVAYHLRRLESVGLVSRDSGTKGVCYRPVGDGAASTSSLS